MNLYNARDLLTQTSGYAYPELPDLFMLAFEDGVNIESTKKQLIYSNFFWEFHRQYINTPILSRHHVSYILKGKSLTTRTHIDLLTVIVENVSKAYNLYLPQDIENLSGLVYSITNEIYNKVNTLAEADVFSLDILDFIEVIEHNRIKPMLVNAEPSKRSINDIYNIAGDVLTNDQSLNNNNLARAVRSKVVNKEQILQCISVRGFLTEVDGGVMPVPVMTNFTRGLNTLYDNIAESRAAAKNLYFSDTKISNTEYFARRLQLLTMVVENIDYNDCGSTEYVDWRVNPPVKDPSKDINYPGDLNFMIGKNYLDEETGTLKQIEFEDPALLNKVIKLRSPLYCKAPNPHQICHVCFGGLSKNVSRFANLGHLSSATMTNQSTSSVLATKHLTSSSVGVAIELGETAAKVFKTNKDRNLFLLRDELKNKSLKITVNREEVLGLTDIIHTDNIENINPSRISRIKFVDVSFMDKSGEINIPISVAEANCSPILTLDFLKYLKVNRWATDGKNNFIFDLSNWNFSLPVMELPETEYSFSDHSSQLAKLIESNMKDIANRANPNSPIATLQELFTLVNSKLNVNLAILEVIMYTNMVSNRDTYDMARNKENAVLDVSDKLTKNRSLGTAYAYESILGVVTDPRSFFQLDRPDSVFDVCISPKEVVEAYKNS